jgi:hypothetical protein
MADDRKEGPPAPSEPAAEGKAEPPLPPFVEDTSTANMAAIFARMWRPNAAALDTNNQVFWPLLAYPRYLMNAARSLIDQGQPSIAVVVAHMACEVATEQKLSEAFATKGLQYLEAAVTDFLNGYNLASDKNRKLYVALTGDEVHNAGFWPKFKASATRRNKIIHEGLNVDKAAAEDSYQAADNLLVHFKL